MVTPTYSTVLRPYRKVVATTAGEAVLTGVWVVTGELPVLKRRLVRAGLGAAIAGIGFLLAKEELVDDADENAVGTEETATDTELTDAEQADEDEDPDAPDVELAAGPGADSALDTTADSGQAHLPVAPGDQTPQLSPLIAAAAGTAAVAVMIGSTVLQRRWLAGLTRNGHPHPYRALAVRVAVLSFIGTLPAKLLDAHEKANVAEPAGRLPG